MAVYRCEVKRISRSSGRSSVAAAAYRAADRLLNTRDERCHDYRRRHAGVMHSEILAPADAPEWARDRGTLWNAAEAAERRKDGTTAREVIISLPHELDDAQRIQAVRQFSQALVERYGVAVDFSVHRPDRQGDQRNHHAHLMLTTRRLGADGLTEKTRELDDRVQGPQQIQAIRALWEQEQNLALERAQSPERVTCQSLAAQGIQRVPQEKIGEKFKALGRQGVSPRVCGDWQEVARRHRASRARPKHRFEREAVARKSAMRQAMERQAATRRGQRGPEIEQAKASAVAWALDAAGKVIDARDEPSAQLVRLQRQQERERAELAARHFELRAKLEAAPVTPRQQLLGTANQLMKQRRKAVESAERERRAMEKAHRLQREEFAKRNPLVPEQTSGKVKTNSQDFGLD